MVPSSARIPLGFPLHWATVCAPHSTVSLPCWIHMWLLWFSRFLLSSCRLSICFFLLQNSLGEKGCGGTISHLLWDLSPEFPGRGGAGTLVGAQWFLQGPPVPECKDGPVNLERSPGFQGRQGGDTPVGPGKGCRACLSHCPQRKGLFPGGAAPGTASRQAGCLAPVPSARKVWF